MKSGVMPKGYGGSPKERRMTVLFETDFEGGRFEEFDHIACNGQFRLYTNTQIVRTGSRAAALWVTPAWFAPEPGVRLDWINNNGCAPDDPKNLPDTAVYSGWYYLLRYYETEWCVIMQWKQVHEDSFVRDPTLLIPFIGAGGKMTLALDSKVGDDGQYTATQGHRLASSDIALPIREWFELKTLYTWAKGPQGRVTSYLNGTLLWDVQGIRTEFDRPFSAHPRQIVWSNYTGASRPSSLGVYIDSVMVETVD
jgi:hypothetical protein